MKEIVEEIRKLMKSEVAEKVKKRMEEFDEIRKSGEGIFSELCFCILTANFSASGGIKIQKALHDAFMNMPEKELAKELRRLGHRFPNTRAKYIVEARKWKNNLKEIIGTFDDEKELREWLVKNVKGIGYKEASHFLRNIGFRNIAIIDYHILDLLCRYKVIEKPKSLTKRKYEEIEKLLTKIARMAGVTLAELDLYLWYMETGKVLK